MGKDVNQYVLSLLETYPETSKRIELMRYELYSSMVVSPQEMIRCSCAWQVLGSRIPYSAETGFVRFQSVRPIS